MGRNYGVSYKGSKSRIVEKLVMAIDRDQRAEPAERERARR